MHAVFQGAAVVVGRFSADFTEVLKKEIRVPSFVAAMAFQPVDYRPLFVRCAAVPFAFRSGASVEEAGVGSK